MEPDMTVPVDEAPAKIVGGEKAEVSPARAALVQSWLEKIKEARAHPKIKKAFERMKMCQRIAATGSQEVAWVGAGTAPPARGVRGLGLRYRAGRHRASRSAGSLREPDNQRRARRL